jgi:NDP-sugar pyrophosphorylase family protein
MQIVILAAGRGTRMSDLTDYVPKPMLKINEKPILAYKLEALPDEVDEVIFIIGYLGNKIQEYFGDFYAGRKISYVVQEKLNGTGGAIALVKDLVEDDFFVMNGDDLYMENDIKAMMKHDLSMLAVEFENPGQFGVVIVDEKGNLVETIEKPKMLQRALVNTGLYKLNKNFFDYPPVLMENGEFSLPATLVSMTDKYFIKIEKATDWFPIGSPENFEKAAKIIDKFI